MKPSHELEAPGESVRLYYFTGKQWGMKSLFERRLKVSLYSEVNDPFELAPFDLSNRHSRAFWNKRVAKLLAGDHGILCFSFDWRNVVMWSHYAEKQTGICLGFDVSRRYAEPMTYVDEPLPDPLLDHRQAVKGLASAVFEAALRHKNSRWDHEQEWRLRVPLSHRSDGIHYREFDDAMHLREVILGPRCTLEPSDLVQAVKSPPLDVEIFKARASFKSFEVCRHELVDTHNVPGFRAALALLPDVYAHDLPDLDNAA